jgi:glycosyltransferase involved in cell wall biosynthesis
VLNKFPNDVELCVSDNDSSDGTSELLNQFKAKNNNNLINIYKQDVNIGSSRNIIDVCCKSNGKWVIVIGDDDGFDCDQLTLTINSLKKISGSPWILVNSINGHNNFNVINVHEEHYKYLSNLKSKFFLIKNGSVRIGFIGVHIFPRQAIDLLYKCNTDEFHMWPHIMLLNKYLSKGHPMLLLGVNPVIQSLQGEGALFWAAKDFYKIEIQKAAMSSFSSNNNPSDLIFNLIMFIRQLYSAHALAYLISWKMKDYNHFQPDFIEFIISYSKKLRFIFKFLLLPMCFIGFFISVLNNKLLSIALPYSYVKKIYALHLKEDSFPSEKNGFLRKL